MRISGVCHFYSETGTEGGYWAVQDAKFMGLENNDQKCSNCGRVWMVGRDEPQPRGGDNLFTYWVPEEGNTIGGYRGYPEPHDDLPLTPGEVGDMNYEFTKRRNDVGLVCYERGFHEWEPMYPDGMWSYEGLHVLRDGDHLTIYDPSDLQNPVWDGIIDLQQHKLFSEDAFNLWIHADQNGVDRETWATYFLKEYPCVLETVEESNHDDTRGNDATRRKRS